MSRTKPKNGNETLAYKEISTCLGAPNKEPSKGMEDIYVYWKK